MKKRNEKGIKVLNNLVGLIDRYEKGRASDRWKAMAGVKNNHFPAIQSRQLFGRRIKGKYA